MSFRVLSFFAAILVASISHAAPPKVVVITAEQEYHARETLPKFFKAEIQSRFDWKVTFLNSDSTTDIKGLEALDDADLLVMYVRRRTLPEAQLAKFKTYVEKGKPIVALRTSSHAFENWKDFDQQVLGCKYAGHHGAAMTTAVRTIPGAGGSANRVLLERVGRFESKSSLYRSSPLAKTATPLLMGKAGDQPEEPVAWTNTQHGGRVFYTSLGHPDDFAVFSFQRLLLNAVLWALGGEAGAEHQALGKGITESVTGARGLEDAMRKLHAPLRETEALSPAKAIKKFKLPGDLAVDLVASEPDVLQPLHLTFDERGRMWVVQYIQFPFPAGLKVVEFDQYMRTKFDKVPPPPPKHFRGRDKITIHEDGDGDGTFEKVKTFVDGLSVCTASLPGRGGVWVLQPPYLLFYPDANRDDVPDGDPVVHLSGFGLEDTHAVASSLHWGPDGWVYGATGSTVTAKIRTELGDTSKTTDFMGQAVWRYHPAQYMFEIFAEGGGNTFGVAFDDAGRVFCGTNWSDVRGLHLAQGAYYVKAWGKHGPLTNPYAFGFFNHMPHQGNADRLTHTYVVYGNSQLPERFHGRIIGPNPLQSRVDVTKLEPTGSTFRTVEEDDALTSEDGWFRPVDLKVGPDGALYVADMYERRITHADPRDTWDRTTGRIWRIRATDAKPGVSPFDLAKLSSAELVGLLAHRDRFYRDTALRVLGDRKDTAIAPELRRMLAAERGQTALEALRALHVMGTLDEETIRVALEHATDDVRAWTVRTIGEMSPTDRAVPLLDLADNETNASTRGQLASTAKRLPGAVAVELIEHLVRRDADAADPYIPMLLWWAVEAHAVSDRDRIVATFTRTDAWARKIPREWIMQRLARRYAADTTPGNQGALVRMLNAAPGEAERKLLLAGVREAFEGREIRGLSAELSAELVRAGDVELSLRAGDAAAHAEALKLIANDDPAVKATRVRYIELLGQVGKPDAVPVLLDAARTSRWHSVRIAALTALGRFDDADIPAEIVKAYATLPSDQEVRPTAIAVLAGRATSAAALLNAVSSGTIPRGDVPPEQMARLRESEDATVAALANKLFPARAKATSDEKSHEIARVKAVLAASPGDASAGATVFAARCANCHTLFGTGGNVGPDLTGYERTANSLDSILLNIIDPSSEIREEFTPFLFRTKRGQNFAGIVVSRGANEVTLVDASRQRTTIAKTDIKLEKALAVSTMPEGLLDGMSDAELRNLFAYVMSPQPPQAAAGR